MSEYFLDFLLYSFVDNRLQNMHVELTLLGLGLTTVEKKWIDSLRQKFDLNSISFQLDPSRVTMHWEFNPKLFSVLINFYRF